MPIPVAGDDNLAGGAGDDTFFYTAGGGQDVVDGELVVQLVHARGGDGGVGMGSGESGYLGVDTKV